MVSSLEEKMSLNLYKKHFDLDRERGGAWLEKNLNPTNDDFFLENV